MAGDESSGRNAILSLLGSIKALVMFESENCLHGVTPSVWDDRVGAQVKHRVELPDAIQKPGSVKAAARQAPVISPSLNLFDAPGSGAGLRAGTPVVEKKSHPGRERPDPEKTAASLEALRLEIGENCRRCPLAGLGRKRVVFGVGNPGADVVFVGEGPGEDEDRQGEPFVGKAGQLLTRMIVKIGRKRNEVYICNIVKCRPPGNREPAVEEKKICGKFLERQIDLIKPRVVVALGKTAAMYLKGMFDVPPAGFSIGKHRGSVEDYRGSMLLLTYHPSYLLRSPSASGMVEDDLKKAFSLAAGDRPA